MVAQDAKGNALWRCSGTLLSDKVFLTAGHCTESPAAKAEIWFDADVQSGVPENGYPYDGPVSGRTYTHPQYDPDAFFLYDLGVVVLQKPFPDASAWKDQAVKIRMVAYPHLLQINTGLTGDFSLLLSNNTSSGGTCFGDSGGPNFLGRTNVVAGVTSFGMNTTCGGTGGVYRVDRSDDLEWLYEEFGSLL